jgi:hypothetical protein
LRAFARPDQAWPRDLPGKRCLVVAFILASPVLPNVPVNVGGSHLTGLPAGKDKGSFLADPVAGYLE